MGVSRQVREAMEGASWIRRMFEEGRKLKQRLGADQVADLALGNPVEEPPEAVTRRTAAAGRRPEPGDAPLHAQRGLRRHAGGGGGTPGTRDGRPLRGRERVDVGGRGRRAQRAPEGPARPGRRGDPAGPVLRRVPLLRAEPRGRAGGGADRRGLPARCRRRWRPRSRRARARCWSTRPTTRRASCTRAPTSRPWARCSREPARPRDAPSGS